MERASITELKKANRSNIFKMIYNERKVSKQSIAVGLNLSLPTVSQNLKELESLQLIEKNGYFESSGGRKPQAICCVSKSRVAFGVEMTTDRLYIVCVDLYGNLLKETSLKLAYQNNREYYRKMGEIVTKFIASTRISARKVLGVGISVQGLVSQDGQYVTYGVIMNCTGAKLSDIAEFIPYPCRLLHDSDAAGFAEIWFTKDIADSMYLSLSQKLGAALILSSALHPVKEIGSGRVEHMIIEPDGRPCYCGKRGCLDAYCSIEALCGHEKEIDAFFAELRRGDEAHRRQWDAYLDTLASALDNVHMVIDCDVILGGHMASYLNDEDVARLNSLAREKCSFKDTRPYIRVGKCRFYAIAIGSALFYIKEFLDTI